MGDQLYSIERQAVRPANECERDGEEAWRSWAALSHSPEQLKLGSIDAANRNQGPCVEVQAEYTPDHVRGKEQTEHVS